MPAEGRELFVKRGEGALDEASGLKLLAGVAGAPPVPGVVRAEPGLLVTRYVAQAPRTPAHEEHLGRGLAVLHRAPWTVWGGGSSFVGACRVDPAPAGSAAGFYGTRLSDLARRCGLEAPVGRLAERLDALLPPGGPSLLHGDLWWGNVLWGADGRAWLVDPSVHGGHPEEDLAMLALFGELPARTVAAYSEAAPPAAGWRDRVPLFQLYPLLVHTVLFGGGYRARAEEILARFAGGGAGGAGLRRSPGR